MTYRIEIDDDDVLLFLLWLENSGQIKVATSVRDQVEAQKRDAKEREELIDDIATNWANTLSGKNDMPE